MASPSGTNPNLAPVFIQQEDLETLSDDVKFRHNFYWMKWSRC